MPTSSHAQLEESVSELSSDADQAASSPEGVDDQVAEATLTGRHRLQVTLIRAGLSNNGNRYPPEVLAEAIALFEGATAFADHPTAIDLTRAGRRSVRDAIGAYQNVHLAGDRLVGELVFLPTAEWAYEMARAAIEARAAGQAAPNIGISADMVLVRRPPPYRPGERGDVARITRVNSADLVFQPSAGGSLDRVLEATTNQEETVPQPKTTTPEQPTAAGAESEALAHNRRDTEAEIQNPAEGIAEPEQAVALAQVNDLHAQLVRGMGVVEAAERIAREAIVRHTFATSSLPDAAKDSIRRRFPEAGAWTVETFLTAVREADEIAAAIGGSPVSGLGGHRQLAHVRTPLDRLQVALDRLLGADVADADSTVPRLSGIREAYIALTGDHRVSGVLVPEESVLEANEVTTSVITNALANSMTKRLTLDYSAQPKWWEPFVSKASVADLKQQQRIHMNDFAALSTVAENGPYTNLAWGDTKETYTPAKKGNLVVVTLESILADDTGSIRRIPTRLAAAAVVTLNEFVAGLFTANAGTGSTMADTFAVFDAANHQGNAGTTALSSAQLQVALIVLAKMTNSASKRIGIIGKYLLVPPDLYFTAQVVVGSTYLPGGSNNDINPVKDAVIPIAVPTFTDTNDWYLMADPSQIEMIELGFLNGRETPELIAQTDAQAGSVFTNDALSWKVRHVFGGAWLDYRGSFGAHV